MIALLNAPILTSFGTFDFWKVDLTEVKSIVSTNGYRSFIGHESTAQILSDLLEVPVEYSREMYCQNEGDIAVVFKLKKRPLEGKILSRKEVEEIGYEFCMLKKVIVGGEI